MSLLRGVLPSRTVDPELSQFPCGIKIWYDCSEAALDIVFVHGLTGDRDRTWTHPSASEPWPKVFLPHHVPKARLLTFGYDAYVLRKGAAVSNQLMNHSRDLLNSLTALRQRTGSVGRPIIFMGHSLGGLVCKNGILQSKTSPETHLRDISQSTTAIAFLGTPHGGSDLASWAKIPAKALGIVKSTNTDLLSILKTTSEVLRQSLNVTSFWESLPMPYIGFIVEKSSASLAGHNAISIRANHRDMVRFIHGQDPGLLSVVGELRRWVDELINVPGVQVADHARAANELREQQKAECLKSLLFAGMDSRSQNIEQPNPKTCEWIFDHSCYKAWNDLNRSVPLDFLWVKGKPGSGKSTMMKNLILKHNRPGTDCLSFYFNARGAQIENSSHGMYRSLVFQLLQRCDFAMDAFLPLYLDREQQTLGEKVVWQAPEISEFFHTALSTMLSRPTYLFIDALDECEEDEVRKVVRRPEECLIMDPSNTNRGSLKICVSSRHFPNITLRIITGQHIFMENHNEEDIKQFVSQELSFDDVELRRKLTLGILEKSAGVFIWTSLVVRRLLKASDQGYSPEQMGTILKRVPPGLEGLLSETLSSLEEERLSGLPLLAAWVICAMRPLSPFELFVALTFSGDRPPVTLVDQDINPTRFDRLRFDKYLIDTSGGLFEIAPSGRVQVIHDSVREFLLESQNVRTLFRLPEGKSLRHYSHEVIFAACEKYFSTEEIRQFVPSSSKERHALVPKLVAMLCQPIPIPIESFALLGDTYFYEFVFVHLQWLCQKDATNLGNATASSTTSVEMILGGWLVVLYYLTLQTGSLSLNQRETIDILFKEPSIIEMTRAEISRISRAVNLLVVFVNKAMKDGFTLMTSGLFNHTLPCSSEYLRLFWRYPRSNTSLNVVTQAPSHLNKNLYRSATYGILEDAQLEISIEGRSVERSFGFGFRIQVAKSWRLADLEWSWLHRYPSRTLPLEDWQIFEEIDMTCSKNEHIDVISVVPAAVEFQSTSHQWRSVTLKNLESTEFPTFSISSGLRTLKSSKRVDKSNFATQISYYLKGLEGEHLAPTLFANETAFAAIAIRYDSELRAYSLYVEPEISSQEQQVESTMS